MKNKIIIFLVVFVSLLFLTGCREGTLGVAIAGSVIETDIRTPHPYPASEEGTQLVWEYRLNDPEALELRLHFKEFEVNGLFLKTSYEEELPPCEPQEPNVEYDEDGNVIAIGSVEDDWCGIVTHKYPLQEIVDNYLEGDYVLIRNNKNGELLSILTNEREFRKNGPNRPTLIEGWGYIYETNDINIELYADENEDKGYGLEIDQYAQLTIGMGAE